MQLDKPMIFFDEETTGVNIALDRIVQIAMVKIMPDGTVDKKSRLVNPEIPIPKQATDIHGITDDMVKNEPTFRSIAQAMYKYMEGCDLGGFNMIRFDLPLLVQEFWRAGIQPDFTEARLVDSMKIYHAMNPRNLSAAYKMYTGKDLEDAHDALADTDATYDIAKKQFQEHKGEIEPTIQAYHDFCTEGKQMLDYGGVFVRNEAGIICFNIGKNKGKPASENKGMINWILKGDFTHDTKAWATKLQKGEII